MVKKILISLILLPFLILFFAPKKELYYLLEHRLKDQGVVVADERISESPVGLTLEHPALYFKGAHVADAQGLSLWSVLLFGRATLENIHIDPAFKRYAPSRLARSTLTFSLLHPTRLELTLTDPAMSGEGEIDLKTRRITLRISKMPNNSPLKQYFKHSKGGWVYETNY